MASIDELQIQGIRAFDHHDRQVIRFGTPLTLIAGPNGSGKTTIIECLRYATTGVLPPNSKGGAFVHDPRMSSETAVLGQVKLGYNLANGKEAAVIVRSMRVTVTKTGLSFKTIDNNTEVYDKTNPNRSRSANARIDDVDAFVPQSMGVPSSILNYVVFCHQEDSLWPLAEASVVKKRFDEIFEATKYTKALETLKTLRKDYGTEVRVEEKTVEHLQQDAERAAAKRKQLEQISQRILRFTAECAALQTQLDAQNAELARVFTINQQFQQVFHQLKQTEAERDRIQEDYEMLATSFEELEYSDERLVEDLGQMDEKQAKLVDEIDLVDKKLAQIADEVDTNAQNQSILDNRRGRLESEMDAQQSRRSSLVGMTNGDEQYGVKAKEALRDIEERYESQKNTHSTEEATLQALISEAEAQRLQLSLSVQEKRKAIRQIETEISSKEHVLSELGGGSTSKPYLETKLAENVAKLEELKPTETLELLSEQLSTLDDHYRNTEHDHEKARRDLKRAAASQDDTAQRSYLQTSLNECLEASKKLDSELAPHIEKLGLSSDSDLEAQLKKLRVEAEQNLSRVSAQAQVASTQIESLKSKVSEAKSHDYDKQIAELRKVLPVSNREEYEVALKTAESDFETATQDVEQSEFVNKFYTAARKMATSAKPKCLLCQAEKSAAEAEKLVVLIDGKLMALPVSPEQAEEELQQARDELEKLRGLETELKKLETLEDEKTKLIALVKSHEAQIADIGKELDRLSRDESAAKARLGSIDAALVPAGRKQTLVTQTQELQAKIDTINRMLSGSQIAQESPQQVQQRIDGILQRQKQLQTERDAAREKQDALRQDVTTLERQIDNCKLQLKEAELAEQKRIQEESRLADLKVQLSKLETQLKTLEESLPDAEKAADAAIAALRTFKMEASTVEAALVNERNTALQRLDLFNTLKEKIEAVDAEYGSDPLGEINAKKAELVEEHDNLKATREAALEERRELEQRQADFGAWRRSYQDTIRIRKLRSERSKLDAEIAELRKQNAEGQKSDYERQTTELRAEASATNNQFSSRQGEIKQLEEHKRSLELELATAYKDTSTDYDKARTRLGTVQNANNDIAVYTKALDSAIMKYHSQKMEDINSVIDELWKRTYTGTDIDTIMIRSEASSGARATYNYRVVMVKQDTELDMRGRCSAGQKVLACIIVRLALSECFGVNCGLLVLDEPTTNLDSANAAALAESLSGIIDSRRSQKNFQLIVITHDEHFLALMNPSQYCSHYYRVQRNSHQLSEIAREPIGQLV